MQNRKQEAIQFLNDANQLYKKGLYQEALDLFKKACNANPLLFEAQFSVAKAQVRLGKADTGVSLLEKALKLVPDDKKNYYILGFAGILFKHKDYKQSYSITKPIFDKKVKANKLPELLKYPLQAKAYEDIIQFLSKYKPHEIDTLINSISRISEVEESHIESFNLVLESYINEQKDVFQKKLLVYSSTTKIINNSSSYSNEILAKKIQAYKESLKKLATINEIVEKKEKWLQLEKEIKQFQEKENLHINQNKITDLKEENATKFQEYNKIYGSLQTFNKTELFPYYNEKIKNDLRLISKEHDDIVNVWQKGIIEDISKLTTRLPILIKQLQRKLNLLLSELSSKAQFLYNQKNYDKLGIITRHLLLYEPSNRIYLNYQNQIKKSKNKKRYGWLALVLLVIFLGVLGYFGGQFYFENQQWNHTTQKNTVKAYQDYLTNHPKGKYVNQATLFVENIAREEAVSKNTTQSLLAFIQKHPKSKYCISVPVIANSKGILKIRGYETLNNDFIYNGKVEKDTIKLVEGSKVEIQYSYNEIKEATLITEVDVNTKIVFSKDLADGNDSEFDISNDGANSKIIPISFVQEAPIYPGCNQKTQALRAKCFERKITLYLRDRLTMKHFRNLKLSKQQQEASYYFEVDTEGNIASIQVKANHKDIIENVKKSIQTLPQFEPAKQNDQSVAVSYMGTLVFNTGKTKEVEVTYTEDNKPVEEFVGTRIPSNITIQMADRAPIYPGCNGKTGITLMKCTQSKISSYIKSNINYENLKGNNLPKGIHLSTITFIITKHGRVSSVSVKNSNEILRNEIKRVVTAMPYMSPALYENIQVPINYRLTLTTSVSLEE